MRSIILGLLATALDAASPQITLNSKEYFEAPGFSFLIFHNTYRGGYQDGLQMIQQDERLLDSGDLYLIPAAGVADTRRVLRRAVDPSRSTATVYAEQAGLGYQLICRTDGTHIFVTLKLDRPIDWTRIEQAGFHIYLFPGAYYSKSFQGESGSGIFPRPYLGRILATGTRVLRIAQEDPLRGFTIRREGGGLDLIDNRHADQQLWYSVNAPIAKGSPETEVHLEIDPTIDPPGGVLPCSAFRRPAISLTSRSVRSSNSIRTTTRIPRPLSGSWR